MNSSRILAICGSILIFLALIGLIFSDQIQTTFNQTAQPQIIDTPPSQDFISEIETDLNCQIKVRVTTTVENQDIMQNDYFIPTNFNPATSECQEYMLKLVSPSQNFLVFEDLDNDGGDTLIKSWSLQDHQVRQIGSVAPDSVIDMTFLPEDVLAILHGKNLSRGMQTIRLYDLNQIEKPFVNLELTDDTQHYYYIASQADQLSVFGPEGIKGAPIQSWPLTEIMSQFNDI